MKILAISGIDYRKPDYHSAVEIWRVWRPLRELAKHVDWQIDFQPTFIKEIEKYKSKEEFTSEELDKAAKHLGKYDIVYSSYHTDATAHALMQAVHDRYGTKYVMDIDDDMFAIDPTNPIWTVVTDDDVYNMQCMIRHNRYMTTTTEALAEGVRRRTLVNGQIYLLPNYISDSYKNNAPRMDDVVIGYFGGSSHYADLHESGVLPALQKLMIKHKNVRFKCVSLPVDYYLPRARTEVIDGARGTKWVDTLFPTLDFDISIAPLRDTVFNNGKSNIKWQESTRMGAAFIASNIGPYKGLPCELVENTEQSWYKGLERLLDAKYRKDMLAKSQQELKKWRLEDHWQDYKQMFEQIKEDKWESK